MVPAVVLHREWTFYGLFPIYLLPHSFKTDYTIMKKMLSTSTLPFQSFFRFYLALCNIETFIPEAELPSS